MVWHVKAFTAKPSSNLNGFLLTEDKQLSAKPTIIYNSLLSWSINLNLIYKQSRKLQST